MSFLSFLACAHPPPEHSTKPTAPHKKDDISVDEASIWFTPPKRGSVHTPERTRPDTVTGPPSEFELKLEKAIERIKQFLQKKQPPQNDEHPLVQFSILDEEEDDDDNLIDFL